MNEYIVDGQLYQVSDDKLDKFLSEFPNAESKNGTPGKLKDPVKETAIAGSANTSSMDSNLENISLESQQNELDNLQATVDALSPTDNSREAILARRKLKKLKQDQIVKLDETEVKADSIQTINNKKYRGRVSSLLKSNTPYQLGIEGGNITEIYNNNSAVLEKELKSLLKNQYSGDPTLPDQQIIDDIVRAEIQKVVTNENKEKEIEKTNKLAELGENDLKQQQINEIEDDHLKTNFTDKQKKFITLNQQKRDLEAKIKNIDDIEEKNKAILEYRGLAAQANNAWNDMEKMYGAEKFFDENGRRISKIEAQEIKATDYSEKYEEIKTKYNSFEYDQLEKEFNLWALDKQDLNEDLNRTIDLKAKDFLSMSLQSQGYKPDESGVYRNVRYEDIMQWRRQPELLNNAIHTDEGGDQILPDLANALNEIHKERININLRSNALDEVYFLNQDPGARKAGIIGGVETFGKEAVRSIVSSISPQAAEDLKYLLPQTRREQLDELQTLFSESNIQLSKEQKEAFDRDFAMQFSEGLGGFVGDLAEFALLNKAAGTAGITARIANIAKKNKFQGFMLNNIMEGVKFQAVMREPSTDMFSEGFFFGAGSQAAGYLIPQFTGPMARFNSLIQKGIGGGAGMAAGSEVAQVMHAVVDDFMKNKDIVTSMQDLYGDLDEAGSRIAMNVFMGSFLGLTKAQAKDFKSIAERRTMFDKLEKEIYIDNKYKGNELLKKQKLLEDLGRDIAQADKAFDNLDLGSQQDARLKAQEVLKNPESTSSEIRSAKSIINRYEANKKAAVSSLNRANVNVKRSGVLGESYKGIEIHENNSKFEGSKAEYNPTTGKVMIDISQYKPGVFGQEIGHTFMKAAFQNNKNVANRFKNKIVDIVNDKLGNERFTVGEKEGLTFEEAIKEAYKKSPAKQPEEYVMNVVEFLSQPKYADLMLKGGLLNEFKRATLNVASRIGLDYTNKKNFKTGSDLMEFLFSIGKIAEGGSSRGIKNKFLAFKDIAIDGKKLSDIRTGEKPTGIYKSTPIKAEKLTPEIQKSVTKNINDLKIARQESIELNKKFNKEGIKTFKEESIERKIIDDIKPTVDSFAENRTKALYDPIAADAKKNVTRNQFRESIKTDLNQMVLNEYDPAKKGKDGKVQTVEKFITNRGFLRANAAAKNLGIKSVEQGIDKQIETSKEANSLTENIVNTRIEPTKKSGTPSVIQANLKVNGKRITEKETTLRDELVKEADIVLEKVADLGFKPGDKGFRKALANEIKTNNPELFDKFTKELGDYNNFINENYSSLLTNQKALPLEFYVQAEKFRANKGENMFVEKVKRATKQAEIREAIRTKKATYTENEAQGVLIYNRLNPPKAKGLEFFKIPNVKKRLIETLYKTSIVDAVINQSRTKKIYSTNERKVIAEKFQKDFDLYYSKELKADTNFAIREGIRAKGYGKEGYFKNAKEQFEAHKNLIDKASEQDLKLIISLYETSNMVTFGGRYFTTNKKTGSLRAQSEKGKFWTSGIDKTGRAKERNQELLDAREIIDVKEIQEYAASKLKDYQQSAAIKHGKSKQKSGDAATIKALTNKNAGNEALTKQAIKEYIDGVSKLFKIDSRTAFDLVYNQNASGGLNRQLAKVIAFEKGIKAGGEGSRLEHMLQNGEFNLLIKEIAEVNNPEIAKKLTDWVANNYRQYAITKATEKIVDDTYRLADGTVWEAKSTLHPKVREAWNKVKNGEDIKIPSIDSRMFNEFFGDNVINPNNIIGAKGISKAKEYGLDVPPALRNNPNVVKNQYNLISDIIFNKATKAEARKRLDKTLPLAKTESIAAKKISKGKTENLADAIKAGKEGNKQAREKQKEVFNSKNISSEFNGYLEKSTGIKKEAIFGDATAMARGKRAKRDFGDYFIPVGAEDFAGLMHKTLAKGKVGEKQLEFYEKHLYDPYNKAVEAITQETMALKNDFRALKKELSGVPKSLKEYTDSGAFTKEHAVRVAVWDKLGYEIPGISNKVKAELLRTVKNDAELNVFANEILKITKGDGYAKPENNWVGGNIAIDMVALINKTKRSKHLEVWQNNVDQIFSKENLNKLEAAYGKKYVTTLTRTLERMKTGSNRKWGGNETVQKWNDWVNGSVGAIMFLNTRSAVLQTISNINYLNFKDNNPLQAAKAFGNQKQYWKDFIELFNSEYLQSRRGGNKINVNESELALAAEKGGMQGLVSLLLNKGFIFTKIADSFAIASGGATMYRNRIKTYEKQGLSKKEAQEKAFLDFKKITEETQQSSRPDRISEQQASNLGRFMLAFANTPMQYNRIIKRNAQDLFAGRGNRAEKITKIIYYSTIQNFIFNALQKALFAMAFSDEDEEAEIKRYSNIGNGMADSLLRGSGLTGNAIVGVKNIALDVANRMNRPQPNFQDAAWKALTVSPPLYSKATKLRGAGYSLKYVTPNNMFEPTLDNPALSAAAQTTSAAFNIPLDRALRKAQNIEAAMSDEAEYWQKAALLLGWGEWELGMDEKSKTTQKRSSSKRLSNKRRSKRRK